jgi:hypothetical protein
MKKRRTSKLVLQSLLDSHILEPTETDEVLPEYPDDIAAAVAIAVVSSFSPSGRGPKLISEFSIDWVMQAVTYC